MDLTLGEKIMLLRKKNKISQREFAKILGINPVNFPNYENNKYRPSLEMLVKIADHLNVSIDSLLRDRDDAAFIINNKKLLDFVKKVDDMKPEDQEFIIETIQAHIKRADAKQKVA